jgi:hypothetical protein
MAMKTNAKIYVLESADGLVKVGHSRRVDKRIKELGKVVSIAHLTEIKVQAEIIERTAHRLLRLAGKGVRGEWFSATVAEAIEAIERAERIADGAELGLDRAPPPDDTILHMRVAEEIRAKLDDLRRLEPDLPSRSEMVRRLIEKAHGRAEKRK